MKLLLTINKVSTIKKLIKLQSILTQFEFKNTNLRFRPEFESLPTKKSSQLHRILKTSLNSVLPFLYVIDFGCISIVGGSESSSLISERKRSSSGRKSL